MAPEPSSQAPPPGGGPSGKPLPLSVRLLGAGVRSARSVSKAAGIDRAVETAAEEAMVAAVESEAVERAIARVLQGPAVEEAMNNALESDAVKHALIDALDSELVDEVWRRLLASDEAQRLVERIAEAPEIRAAISAQSMGLIEDVGHTIGNGTRRLDAVVERVVRRIFFRKRRTEPTDRAGAATANGKFAYIVAGSFAYLSQFHVREGGLLQPLAPATLDSHSHPTTINFHPTGSFLYVTCSHGAISQFRLNSNGSLTPLNPPEVYGENDPSPLRFDRAGHYACVVTGGVSGHKQLDVYRVARDGTLKLDRRLAAGDISIHAKSVVVQGGIAVASDK